MFVGLAVLVAVVVGIISVASVSKKSEAQAVSQYGAQQVINATGGQGFPFTGTYTSKGGTLIISAAGSGWSDTKDQLIGMNVYVDNNKVGTAQVWTNEAASHKAFVPVFAVVNNVSKGPHTIKLEPLNSATNTDQNDYFRVTVEEQPRG
jgi:hypothetical protein